MCTIFTIEVLEVAHIIVPCTKVMVIMLKDQGCNGHVPHIFDIHRM